MTVLTLFISCMLIALYCVVQRKKFVVKIKNSKWPLDMSCYIQVLKLLNEVIGNLNCSLCRSSGQK